MEVFLASLILIGFGVFGMCFNIIFRKKDFPQTEVSENEEMKKLGIRCMHEIDNELFGSKKKRKDGNCTGNHSDACAGCGFNTFEK